MYSQITVIDNVGNESNFELDFTESESKIEYCFLWIDLCSSLANAIVRGVITNYNQVPIQNASVVSGTNGTTLAKISLF